MYCQQCGTDLPNYSAFCLACGTPVDNVAQGFSLFSLTKNVSRVPVLVFVLLMGGFTVFLLMLNRTHHANQQLDLSKSSEASFLSLPTLLPTISIVPHEEKLFSGSIAINAHSMHFINFTVHPQMKNVHMSGHFQAYGGRRNDVQVIICSNDDFINFRNGHQAQSFYNSNKITVGDIDVSIPPIAGDYVLAFNNTFSIVSGKTVNGEVSLSYDTSDNE